MRTRRGGAKILARLSTLQESKTRLVEDPSCMSLLISMLKHHDYTIRFTTAKTIAE